jgi:hypothetical protein
MLLALYEYYLSDVNSIQNISWNETEPLFQPNKCGQAQYIS